MSLRYNRRSWPEILHAARIVKGTDVEVGEHGEDIGPINTEDLLEIRVSVHLLSAMVFMEVLSPSPGLNVWRARNGGNNSIQRMGAESMRIMEEHDELKHRFLMLGEVDERALGHLTSDIRRVDAVISPRMVNVRSE
jgi:hypothetical protein